MVNKSLAPRYWDAAMNQAAYYQPGGPKKMGICVHHQAGMSSNLLNTYNSRGVSAHYQATKTDIKQNVRESDRAYATGVQYDGTRWGQDYLISIETQNDGGNPDWHVSDGAVESLIQCLVGIAQNQGWVSLHWHGDKNMPGYVCGHRDLGATACPGNYLYYWLPSIVDRANNRLKEVPVAVAPKLDSVAWLYPHNRTAGQMFQPVWINSTWFKLRHPSSEKCLDVSGAGTKSGTYLQFYKENGTDAQLFKLQEVPIGAYKPASVRPFYLIPKITPKLRVTPKGNSVKEGARLVIAHANSVYHQEWTIADWGNGYWTLFNNGAQMPLDIQNGG